MIKNEQSRNIDQTIRPVPIAPVISVPPPQIMFQTASTVLPSRSIDPNAIDITSIKGQFAWEKILQNDTYIPVIFRYVKNNFSKNVIIWNLRLSAICMKQTIVSSSIFSSKYYT
jgi:hypothetical protein